MRFVNLQKYFYVEGSFHGEFFFSNDETLSSVDIKLVSQ